MSDALAVAVVLLWLTVKITHSSFTFPLSFQKTNSRLALPKFSIQNSEFKIFFSAFCIFTTLSLFWSRDWRTSLYIALHFWLIFLLILSLRDWHTSWTVAMFGLCAALSIQLIMGFIGYALQSTAFLAPLKMNWPGMLDPTMRGASVVQLANSLRILRAYGTMPHPNILGGLVFVTLLGPLSLFLTSKRSNYPALLLLSLGIIPLILTFSRSAWLALAACLGVLTLNQNI